jgi:hypothetical protein
VLATHANSTLQFVQKIQDAYKHILKISIEQSIAKFHSQALALKLFLFRKIRVISNEFIHTFFTSVTIILQVTFESQVK